MIALSINGKPYEADVEDDTPLLWVLRDTLGLTGTNMAAALLNVAPAPCILRVSQHGRARSR